MDRSNWTAEDWAYYERAAIAATCAWIQRPTQDHKPHIGAATAGDEVATKLVELKRERKQGK